MCLFAHQKRYSGADLNSFPVPLRGEYARIGLTIRRQFACSVLITVQAVHADRVEDLQVALPHPCERETVQPRVIRDKADDAPACLLHDTPFRHTIEPDIEIVQSLPLWGRR